jgi:release factor glutamine methyltransferase
MTEHFQAKSIDSPRLVAEMLLSHVIGCERMRLYMEVDRPASPDERERLRELVQRASQHEPVQYLVGHAWFFSRDLEVNRSTLIPRSCTESLVEHVLQWHRASNRSNMLIADIGTGTGCIAISLAAQIKDARVVATDVIPEALELAKRNATRHNVADRIEFRAGSLLEPLHHGPPGRRFDLIVSNPPYIPENEWADVEPNVKEYEPASALRGGVDGLDYIRPLVQGAGKLLAEDGQLVIEIASVQRQHVVQLAKASGFGNCIVLKDDEDKWRVLVAQRDDENSYE